MELRVLKYFLAVAREENISKAAEFVNTTQPNLSRQMHNLEEEIGKPLFERGSRRIVLTEAGNLLRKRAEEIVELCDKAEQELTANDDDVSGDIYIGCGESYTMKLIAQVINRTRQNYPNIKFHLFSGDSSIVSERLDKGLLDFAIMIDYHDLSKYNYLSLPLLDTWGILMRNDCPLAQKQSVTAQDLKSLPILLSQQPMDNRRHCVNNWFSQADVTPEIIVTYNLIYNAALLVQEGIGYAVTLDNLARTEDTNLCFKPLSPRLESHWDIAWKKYKVFPRAAEIFLATLKEMI